MPSLLRRWKQRFCKHDDKRVWDMTRAQNGVFLVRVYCPVCGKRWDVERVADDVIEEAAKDNDEMRDLMRRNLGVSDEDTTET